jgi:hypothetical protein
MAPGRRSSCSGGSGFGWGFASCANAAGAKSGRRRRRAARTSRLRGHARGPGHPGTTHLQTARPGIAHLGAATSKSSSADDVVFRTANRITDRWCRIALAEPELLLGRADGRHWP